MAGAAVGLRLRSALPLALASTLAGCSAGSGEGLDEQGRPLTQAPPAAPGAGDLAPEFAAIQAAVFDPICTECHAGPAAAIGMRLSADVSYAMLVGVASLEMPGLLRVAPGDPDASYLVRKLEGRDIVGGRMPLGRAPLPQAQIDAIRSWIAQGAPQGAPPPPEPAPSPDPPAPEPEPTPTPEPPPAPDAPARIDASVPAAGETLRAIDGEPSIPELVLVCSAPLDASSVRSDTVMLLAAGGDGEFDAGHEQPIELTELRFDATTQSIRARPGAALPADRYRLSARGDGAAPLQDLSANALDGDADGLPGGDFRVEFAIERLAFAPTLAAIQSKVFDPICSECHAGTNATLGMRLEPGLSHAQIVGVASVEVPALQRIAPGDPEASYLVQKIEGRAAVGARMPLGRAPLAQTVITAIRAWVADGAKP